MDLAIIGQLALGMALLIGGAELLVRGACALANALGVSPLIIGLTVVAWGTGSPELAVSLQSTLAGDSAVAVGNVVGSNISNILLILGVTTLAAPVLVDRQLLKLDVPVMIAASLLLIFFSRDGMLDRVEGAVFVAAILAYTFYLFWASRRASPKFTAAVAQAIRPKVPWWRYLLYLVSMLTGLGGLVWGSQFLVDAAVQAAEALGVSQLVIGLTVVAIGTSLPEAATSVMAALRGERGIAVGNAVGSNIFNILAVLGLTAVAVPTGVEVPAAAAVFDMPVMVGAAVICLPIFFSGGVISRAEGLLLLSYYVAYLVYLVLDATQHHRLEAFSTTMLWFVIPATLVLLAITTLRATRRGGAGEPSDEKSKE